MIHLSVMTMLLVGIGSFLLLWQPGSEGEGIPERRLPVLSASTEVPDQEPASTAVDSVSFDSEIREEAIEKFREER
ncbi:MAG: hypothetical protein QF645_04410, partial [Planctomycetota bacterium]|nr:hypothetical protein [Planctomycetota bacterium]